MNASASADGRHTRAWPQLDNVTRRDVSNAHVQGGRRRLPAVRKRCWQANWAYPAKNRTIERPPARWCGREHAAQRARKQRAVGSSTGRVKRQDPGMSMHEDSSPAPAVGGAAPRLERGHHGNGSTSTGGGAASISKQPASRAHAPREDGGTPDTLGRPNAAPILAPHHPPTSGPA